MALEPCIGFFLTSSYVSAGNDDDDDSDDIFRNNQTFATSTLKVVTVIINFYSCSISWSDTQRNKNSRHQNEFCGRSLFFPR